MAWEVGAGISKAGYNVITEATLVILGKVKEMSIKLLFQTCLYLSKVLLKMGLNYPGDSLKIYMKN